MFLSRELSLLIIPFQFFLLPHEKKKRLPPFWSNILYSVLFPSFHSLLLCSAISFRSSLLAYFLYDVIVTNAMLLPVTLSNETSMYIQLLLLNEIPRFFSFFPYLLGLLSVLFSVFYFSLIIVSSFLHINHRFNSS